MYKIIADSSVDIKELPGANFETVALQLYNEEKSFSDDASLNVDEMVSYFESLGKPSHTSCPSSGAWMSAYEGAEEVFVFTISSGLSGSYNSAMVAKEMFLETNPNVKIEVFDSLSIGCEMKLCMELIIKLKDEGKSFEEVVSAVNEYRKTTHLFFVLASVKNLAANGRVNKIIAAGINALGIRLIGEASDEGKIEIVGKARGQKRASGTLMEHLKKEGFTGGKVRMCYAIDPELAEIVKADILKEYPEADIEVYPAGGLCSFYAERGGIIIGIEGK